MQILARLLSLRICESLKLYLGKYAESGMHAIGYCILHRKNPTERYLME